LVNSLILRVAAASYFIFLVHAFAFKLLDTYGAQIRSPVLRVALLWGGSVIAGLTIARIWNPMLRRARESTWRVSDGLRVRRPRTA
jgi:peptidoglycan/LPS O-acetylase OafA/YrhL